MHPGPVPPAGYQPDPEIVRDITLDAIADQDDADTRRVLTDDALSGRTVLYGVDGEGYHSIAVGGRRIVRVHWSRLQVLHRG